MILRNNTSDEVFIIAKRNESIRLYIGLRVCVEGVQGEDSGILGCHKLSSGSRVTESSQHTANAHIIVYG